MTFSLNLEVGWYRLSGFSTQMTLAHMWVLFGIDKNLVLVVILALESKGF